MLFMVNNSHGAGVRAVMSSRNDQRQASSDAPPFSTVARNPNFIVDRLAFFLLDPHPKMPNMSLTRIEATDLAAYIASLAK